MSKVIEKSRNDFINALKDYNESLANENQGIFIGAVLSNRRNTKVNILTSVIGFVAGIFTGHGFYSTSEPEKGGVALTNDGYYFFVTETERIKEDGKRVKRLKITQHYFFRFADIRKVVTGRNFIFAKHFRIQGVYPSGDGSKTDIYNLSIPPLENSPEQMKSLKDTLKSHDIKMRKGKSAFVCGAFLAAVLGLVLFILVPRWTNAYREMDYAVFRHEINSPTHTLSGVYQDRTTSFSARIATDIFTIVFEDGESKNFVGAEIAGNDRIFLIELSDNITVQANDVVEVRAVGRGVITTTPQPEENIFGRFFESFGVAFGDPRITGVVAEISNDSVLSGFNYLHMRAVSIETAAAVHVESSDIFLSANGDYSIKFVEAYHTTAGVGRNQTDVIVIYYDYEARTVHNINRPFTRNFVVYQGDVEIEFWDGGLRASGDRNFLTTQDLSAGEIFHAMRAVVPINLTDPIKIVRYNENFQMIYYYELPVRYE